jgi:hypothetical protein
MAVNKKQRAATLGRLPSAEPKLESAVFAISHETSRRLPTDRGHGTGGPIGPHFICERRFPRGML